MDKVFDIAIIGSGPAGLNASIYASRYKLSNIVFGGIVGGTITEAHKVCNYPGTPNISGMDLGMGFFNQAKEEGGEFVSDLIVNVEKKENLFELTGESGKTYTAKTVLLGIGTNRRKLAMPKEDKFLGKGLSYCATCDAMFYRDKTVAVIGGSNAATTASILLADIAKKVYLIYRGKELRGEMAWVEAVKEKNNVEIIYQTVLTDLEGDEKLERVKLSKRYNDSEYLETDGVFVEIGSEPNTALPQKMGLELDEKDYIKVDQAQKTSLEGVWAAGDCTTASNKFQQVVTAVSEGAIAVNSIYMYVSNKKKV